jgi:hypothetical protein
MEEPSGAKQAVPLFNGANDRWPSFRYAFEAFASTANLGDVLFAMKDAWVETASVLYPKTSTEEEEQHTLRVEYMYNAHNRRLYGYLQQATVRATQEAAQEIVKSHRVMRDGAAAWANLVDHYEKLPGQDAVAALTDELMDLQCKENENPLAFWGRMRDISERLESLNAKQDNALLRTLFLRQMSRFYEHEVATYHSVTATLRQLGQSDTRTVNQIVETFAAAHRRKSYHPPDEKVPDHALRSDVKQRSGVRRDAAFQRGQGGPRGATSSTRCFACDGFGHFAKHCPQLKAQQEEKALRSEHSRSASGKSDDGKRGAGKAGKSIQFAAITVSALPTDGAAVNRHAFVLDSASTMHMSFAKEDFECLEPIDDYEVTVGGMGKLKATHKGTVRFNARGDDGSIIPCSLADTLFVPDLGFRLMSETLVMERVGNVVWDNPTSSVRVFGNGFSLSFERHGNLWILPMIGSGDTEHALITTIDAHTAHLRFGHASPAKINALVKQGHVTLCDGEASTACKDCCVCNTAKMSRHDVSKAVTHSGEAVVQADIAVFPRSLRNERFALVFLDRQTRYAAAYALKSKSTDSVVTCLDHYLSTVVPLKRAGARITVVQTDAESQLTSPEWEHRCAQSGVLTRHSPPHTQAKNGGAEKVIGTLQGIMRAFMHQARASVGFWALAFLAAVYCYNRLPNSAIGFRLPYIRGVERAPRGYC